MSSTWFKLGFPLCYWSDVLETLAVLVALGYSHDPRLVDVYHRLMSKQDAQGRWTLKNSLNLKMWIDIEKKASQARGSRYMHGGC